MEFIFENVHYLAYGAIIATACYGIINVILLMRQLSRRRFRNEKSKPKW